MRIKDHPILGKLKEKKEVEIIFDGKKLEAYEGEMISTTLIGSGIKVFRYTSKYNQPRGIFWAIGRCTDCVMEVNGEINVRTCITPVKEGMIINTQKGLGIWKGDFS